jgi:ferrochelatase
VKSDSSAGVAPAFRGRRPLRLCSGQVRATLHLELVLSSPEKNAVLLLAHGSPVSVDDIPEFLSQITRGRPAPAEVIDEVKQRYRLIGRSPLTELTLRQGKLLAEELKLPVYVGMRNWKPFIADTVRTMKSDEVESAVVICLAPQNSRTSVGLYRAALNVEGGSPFAVDFVESWHDHRLLIKAFAEKLRAGWGKACKEMSARLPVIFTAHSVPQRTVADGDPYETQAKETAKLVAHEASLASEDWKFAFQSQGMSGGPWLGPTVESTILGLKEHGHRGVFVQPIGFLCDHVEVLYDIDIGFKQFAEKEGMRFWRAESLNDSPLLTAALAELARSRMKR